MSDDVTRDWVRHVARENIEELLGIVHPSDSEMSRTLKLQMQELKSVLNTPNVLNESSQCDDFLLKLTQLVTALEVTRDHMSDK